MCWRPFAGRQHGSLRTEPGRTTPWLAPLVLADIVVSSHDVPDIGVARDLQLSFVEDQSGLPCGIAAVLRQRDSAPDDRLEALALSDFICRNILLTLRHRHSYRT